ncbi:hypothetical protein C824_004843 [Schaedlerella arabinosiphila]|nr:hypothetical protein C824_004843 [Schaedlerella arabinosiphila]
MEFTFYFAGMAVAVICILVLEAIEAQRQEGGDWI